MSQDSHPRPLPTSPSLSQLPGSYTHLASTVSLPQLPVSRPEIVPVPTTLSFPKRKPIPPYKRGSSSSDDIVRLSTVPEGKVAFLCSIDGPAASTGGGEILERAESTFTEEMPSEDGKLGSERCREDLAITRRLVDEAIKTTDRGVRDVREQCDKVLAAVQEVRDERSRMPRKKSLRFGTYHEQELRERCK